MKKTVVAFILLLLITNAVLLTAAVMEPGNPLKEQLNSFAITVLIPACVACMPWRTTIKDPSSPQASAKKDTKPLFAAAIKGAFHFINRIKR